MKVANIRYNIMAQNMDRAIAFYRDMGYQIGHIHRNECRCCDRRETLWMFRAMGSCY